MERWLYNPCMHCGPCNHPHRDRIDMQIINGIPYRTIVAENPGLSLGALSRHRAHITEMLRERTQEERAEQGNSLLSRVEDVITGAYTIVKLAKEDKSYAAASNALNSIIRCLDLLGHLTGELQAPGAGIHFHQTRNITNIVNVNDDSEIAMLFAEFTRNFHPDEIQRLKLLVSASDAAPDVPSR
jgi:hypothetical protein